jgi:arginine decarboxylase
MDQSQAPLLDALADYHRSGRYGFTPPGHRQGHGTDAPVLAVLGKGPFRADLLATARLNPTRQTRPRKQFRVVA